MRPAVASHRTIDHIARRPGQRKTRQPQPGRVPVTQHFGDHWRAFGATQREQRRGHGQRPGQQTPIGQRVGARMQQRQQQGQHHAGDCQQGGAVQRRPVEAHCGQAGKCAAGGEETQCGSGQLAIVEPGIQLGHATGQPPQRGPHQQRRGGNRQQTRPVIAGGVGEATAEEAGQRNQRGAEALAVEQRPDTPVGFEPAIGHKEGARRQLQHQTRGHRQLARLAGAHPQQGRAFHGPGGGGPLAIDGQRNGQGKKGDAQREEGLNQQAQTRPRPAVQPARQHHIEAAEGQRAPGQAVGHVLHQRGLQAETDHRGAEHQGAVDIILERRRAAPGVEHGGGDVHQHESDQEGLGAGEQRGVVVFGAPGQRDGEGEHEADQVEHPPGFLPGHGEQAGVEQQVVAEEHHMAALPGRGDDGRHEAAGNADHRQRLGVLQHGQRSGEDHHGQQEREAERGRNHLDHAHGGKNGEVEHAHAAALQAERVAAALLAQTPADHQQRDAT